VCTPASGSTFPIGSTNVQCTATDSNGHTSAGSFVVTVTTANTAGRMVGDAEIAAANTRRTVVFFVQEHATGSEAGALTYTVTTTTTTNGRRTVRVDSFVAFAVTNVAFFDVPGVSPPSPPSGVDSVAFEGNGRWNGRPGYRFTAQAVDAAQPGRNQDRFAITIRDGAGAVVSSVDATITAGEIRSLRIGR
jgi:hypothetical protein